MPHSNKMYQTRRSFIKNALLATCATTTGIKAAHASTDDIHAMLYNDGQLDIYVDGYEPRDEEVTKEWSIPRDQGYNAGKSPFYSHGDLIKSVTVFSGVRPITMRYWFADCNNLIYADFSGIDTSNCIDMEGLFAGCCSLRGTKTMRHRDVVFNEILYDLMIEQQISWDSALGYMQWTHGGEFTPESLSEADCTSYCLDLTTSSGKVR